MSKARDIVGIITGIILILSSGAHSFLGWRAMRQQLVAANAPADLITGLAIGWNFAGLAIFVFGVMATWVFVSRLRGLDAPLWIPRLIAIAYALAGGVSYQMTRQNFFLTVFVVPGVLLALCSWSTDPESE